MSNIERVDMKYGVNVRTAADQGKTIYQVFVNDRLVLQSRDPRRVIKQAEWLEKEKANGR